MRFYFCPSVCFYQRDPSADPFALGSGGGKPREARCPRGSTLAHASWPEKACSQTRKKRVSFAGYSAPSRPASPTPSRGWRAKAYICTTQSLEQTFRTDLVNTDKCPAHSFAPLTDNNAVFVPNQKTEPNTQARRKKRTQTPQGAQTQANRARRQEPRPRRCVNSRLRVGPCTRQTGRYQAAAASVVVQPYDPINGSCCCMQVCWRELGRAKTKERTRLYELTFQSVS